MSLPDTNKSGTDVSSNSSWSVIEETGGSPNSSLQDILIQPQTDKIDGSDEDTRTSDIENSFITIPEDAAWTVGPGEHVPPPRKSKKKSKKHYAEPLSIVTIIASILTITGITLLCMLFPQDIDTQSYDHLHRAYIEVVSKADESVPEAINKTSEVLKVIQDVDLLSKIHQRLECDDDGDCSCKEEDTCPARQDAATSDTDHGGFDSFAGKKEKKVSVTKKTRSKVTTKKVKKHASVSDAKEENATTVEASHPKKTRHPKTVTRAKAESSNLKIQSHTRAVKNRVNASEPKREAGAKPKDVSIIKTASLALPQFSEIADKLANQVDNKTESIESVQPSPLLSISVTKKVPPAHKTAFDLIDRITKRNDSQQRIEELRKKWESAGNEHRERVQLIKAEFKDEVQQAKQAEMESSQRAHKMKIIRDKYVARLKMDKERYLAQLRRFREDKQTLIDEICRKIKQHKNQKDASVGNYAVLLDDYDFSKTLRNLQCNSFRSYHLETMNLIRDAPENLAKYQSGDDIAIDLDIADIGPGQSLTASYASKVLAGLEGRNTSSSQEESETKDQQPGLEKASVREAIKKMVFNESKTTINDDANNSKVSIHQALVKDEKRERTPLERLRALRNNKEDRWLEYGHKDNHTTSEHEKTRVSTYTAREEDDRKNDSFKPAKVMVKTPAEAMEEDRRNSDDIFGHTLIRPKEDDTSGEETEDDNSSLTTEDGEGQFKVVVRRKGRKRDIYGAAFDENGQKIKETDMLKWGLERRMRSPQSYIFSKQDPKRAIKDKFSFKGPF
nr:unnamed protein product [Callosobruchus analis]